MTSREAEIVRLAIEYTAAKNAAWERGGLVDERKWLHALSVLTKMEALCAAAARGDDE